MKEKKKVDISAILLVIAIIVIIIMGSCLYILYEQRNDELSEEDILILENVESQQDYLDIEESEEYKTKSYLYKHLKDGIEIETLLPEKESLKITDMEMDSEGNIIITGDIYEEYVLSKKELEDLKKGRTIELNGTEYKYNYKKGKKYIETEDAEIEYEIEQLVPIGGGKGVYSINSLEYNEKVRLIYADTEDLIEYVGSQELGIYSDLFNTNKKMTIKVNKDVRGYTMNWVSDYYINNNSDDGEIEGFWDMEEIEYYYKSYKENDFLPIEHFNFVIKDGEIVEYWRIRSDYMAT